MNTLTMKHAIAVGLAGALALAAATPVLAAPVHLDSSAVKAVVAKDVIDVRHRGRAARRFQSGGAAAAVGAMGVIGAIAGAAASQSYGPDYYGYGPGYEQGYYGAPAYGRGYGPGYAPGYPPAYGYRRCIGDERFGC